jgi:hypothetical protein
MRRTTSTIVSRALAIVAAFVVTMLVACKDGGNGPTGPGNIPEAIPATTVPADTTSGEVVDMLLWETPLASDVVVTKKIGSGGGTVELKGASTIRLIVPKGAVLTYTNFTITRSAGRIVSYDFQPHGARFLVPVRIEHETRGTNFSTLAPDAVVQAVYFADATLVDQLAGTLVANEFLQTGLTATKDKILFSTGHFSGYGVSTGRRPQQ